MPESRVSKSDWSPLYIEWCENAWSCAFGLAYSVCRCPGSAEDAVQESICEMIERSYTFENQQSLQAMLLRITRQRAIKISKRRGRERPTDTFDALLPADESSEPNEHREHVSEVFNQLNTHDRELLVLYHSDRKTMEEIGEVFGISRNTVRPRLRQAETRFRTLYWADTFRDGDSSPQRGEIDEKQ